MVVTEGRFCLLQEERVDHHPSPRGRRVPPIRVLVLTVAAGLGLGVLLTVSLFTLFSSYRQCSSSSHESVSDSTTSMPSIRIKTKKSFIFTEEKKNWYQALADCHRRGMIFAEIDDEKEHTDLVNSFHTDYNNSTEAYWLGGADLGHGSFVWMSTGRSIPSTNTWWYRDEHVKEPNNDFRCEGEAEHCVELLASYDYKMNDNCCHETKAYVCQQWQS